MFHIDASYAIIDFRKTVIPRCKLDPRKNCNPIDCEDESCEEKCPLTHIKRGCNFVGSSLIEEIRPISEGVPPIGAYRINDNCMWRSMPSEWMEAYPECLRDEPHVYVVEILLASYGKGDKAVLKWQRDVYVERKD